MNADPQPWFIHCLLLQYMHCFHSVSVSDANVAVLSLCWVSILKLGEHILSGLVASVDTFETTHRYHPPRMSHHGGQCCGSGSKCIQAGLGIRSFDFRANRSFFVKK